MPRAEPREVLAIMVKAPRPGLVKTRIAKSIGPAAATRLYRRLASAVVSRALSGGLHETAVWYSPAESQAEVARWLGKLGLTDLRAQRSGGLGMRLSGVARQHFAEGANRVVVIGSDCPEVDRGVVRRAFHQLNRADVVLGPSLDGGFYLVGFRAPTAGLWRGVAWSTATVFDQVVRNVRRLGLRLSTLPVLRDVDTVEDARALGWLRGANSHRGAGGSIRRRATSSIWARSLPFRARRIAPIRRGGPGRAAGAAPREPPW